MFLQQRFYLAGIGVPPTMFFGENQFAVHDDLKHPAFRGEKRNALDFDLVSF